MTLMFLNGGGMRGGSLHHLLRGAALIAATTTAPLYRLYSVGDRYPALQLASESRHPALPGAAIAGEIYDLPLSLLRDDLLPAEPPELELGVIELGRRDGRPRHDRAPAVSRPGRPGRHHRIRGLASLSRPRPGRAGHRSGTNGRGRPPSGTGARPA
jgi:hypothetical protein